MRPNPCPRSRSLPRSRPPGKPVALAITIRADNSSAGEIERLWDQVGVFEVEPSMRALGYRPHFTFAIYDAPAIDEKAAWDALLKAVTDETQLRIEFKRIRWFEGPPLVLWAEMKELPGRGWKTEGPPEIRRALFHRCAGATLETHRRAAPRALIARIAKRALFTLPAAERKPASIGQVERLIGADVDAGRIHRLAIVECPAQIKAAIAGLRQFSRSLFAGFHGAGHLLPVCRAGPGCLQLN